MTDDPFGACITLNKSYAKLTKRSIGMIFKEEFEKGAARGFFASTGLD